MDVPAMIDERVVTTQLGRPPRGPLHVAVRCEHGFPQVIRVHPILQGRPFPTLYWLTCPFLRTEISKLESLGGCRSLERYMEEVPDVRMGMDLAHERYAMHRLSLLSRVEAAQMQGDGTLGSLLRRGIGGVADRKHLKCLHLHAAHALADANPIGEEVLRRVGRSACLGTEKICSAY